MHNSAQSLWMSCVWGAVKGPFFNHGFSTHDDSIPHPAIHTHNVVRRLSMDVHSFCTQKLCKKITTLTDYKARFPHNTQALLLLLLILNRLSVVNNMADKSWKVLHNDGQGRDV